LENGVLIAAQNRREDQTQQDCARLCADAAEEVCIAWTYDTDRNICWQHVLQGCPSWDRGCSNSRKMTGTKSCAAVSDSSFTRTADDRDRLENGVLIADQNIRGDLTQQECAAEEVGIAWTYDMDWNICWQHVLQDCPSWDGGCSNSRWVTGTKSCAGSCPTDESCTTWDDCYKDGKMCDGVMDAGCLCKNGQCKKSSGCGIFEFTSCSTCNEEDCEDEGACQWMNWGCRAL